MDAVFTDEDVLEAFKLMVALLKDRRVYWDAIVILRFGGATWEAGWVNNEDPANPAVVGYCQCALPYAAASGIVVRALRELKPRRTTLPMRILYLHCTDQSWVWVDNHLNPQLDAAGKITKVDITLWN